MVSGCSMPASESTSGKAFTAQNPLTVTYNENCLQGNYDAGIDYSNSSFGYICALGSCDQRLKIDISCNGKSYCSDLPNDGKPVSYPLAYGNGTYAIKIMRNTSENRYVQAFATSVDVDLQDEFQPFLYPNLYCDFNPQGACAKTAREITKNAKNQGDAVAIVFDYVTSNVAYDSEKANELEGKTGYLPNPDETLASGAGICTDYASATAAMLRSIGIPTKIVIGEVHPDNLPHAWNMVYINGTWKSLGFSVEDGKWSIIDPTLYAQGIDLSKLSYDAIHEY